MLHHEYLFQVILDDISLLGLKPDVYSYTSDHFDTLLSLCERMIREGKAYADDTDPEMMKKEREERTDSKNRNSCECLLLLSVLFDCVVSMSECKYEIYTTWCFDGVLLIKNLVVTHFNQLILHTSDNISVLFLLHSWLRIVDTLALNTSTSDCDVRHKQYMGVCVLCACCFLYSVCIQFYWLPVKCCIYTVVRKNGHLQNFQITSTNISYY